jgi:NAD(P)-dependent dehydrogenase (short-subunit alcohol dehydrogenase family)
MSLSSRSGYSQFPLYEVRHLLRCRGITEFTLSAPGSLQWTHWKSSRQRERTGRERHIGIDVTSRWTPIRPPCRPRIFSSSAWPTRAAGCYRKTCTGATETSNRSPIVFDDIHFQRRADDPWLAYGQSKTANALFAVEAARGWADDAITANAVMPGAIRTNLLRYRLEAMTPEVQATFDGFPWKTIGQGAATSVLLAASPLVHGVSGRYFEDCNEAEVTTDPSLQRGVWPHALDEEDAARLWAASEAMLRPAR